MNYLNGGYIMVKYNATQTELQKAYESKRPIIAYDSNMRGQFATIELNGGTYSIKYLKDSGAPLVVVDIYAKEVDTYVHHYTCFVDDLTLETYADLKSYLTTKGYTATSALVCSAIVSGGSQNVTALQVNGDDIVDIGGNILINDIDFGITYLGA